MSTEDLLKLKKQELSDLQQKYYNIKERSHHLDVDCRKSHSEIRELQERLSLLSLKLAETQETAKTEEERLKSRVEATTELLMQERTTFGATIHELTAQLLQE